MRQKEKRTSREPPTKQIWGPNRSRLHSALKVIRYDQVQRCFYLDIILPQWACFNNYGRGKDFYYHNFFLASLRTYKKAGTNNHPTFHSTRKNNNIDTEGIKILYFPRKQVHSPGKTISCVASLYPPAPTCSCASFLFI